MLLCQAFGFFPRLALLLKLEAQFLRFCTGAGFGFAPRLIRRLTASLFFRLSTGLSLRFPARTLLCFALLPCFSFPARRILFGFGLGLESRLDHCLGPCTRRRSRFRFGVFAAARRACLARNGIGFGLLPRGRFRLVGGSRFHPCKVEVDVAFFGGRAFQVRENRARRTDKFTNEALFVERRQELDQSWLRISLKFLLQLAKGIPAVDFLEDIAQLARQQTGLARRLHQALGRLGEYASPVHLTICPKRFGLTKEPLRRWPTLTAAYYRRIG